MYNLYNLEANFTINKNFRKRDFPYHLAEIVTTFLFLGCLIFWLFI